MSRQVSVPKSSAAVGTTPAAQMRPLQRLIGTWLTEGVLLKRGKPTDVRFSFVDRYQWLPGGHFIAHTVNGELEGASLQGLEIIGYDGRVLRATSYDSVGIVTHYRPRLKNRTWSLKGTKERFLGTFAPDNKRLDGVWERRNSHGEWHATMQVTLTRIGA